MEQDDWDNGYKPTCDICKVEIETGDDNCDAEEYYNIYGETICDSCVGEWLRRFRV